MSQTRKGDNYTNILTATTTTIKSGKGVLVRVIVNKPVANGVITIYDNTAGSGTKIATITHAATLLQGEGSIEFGVQFTVGLTVVTGSTDDVTFVWQ